MAKGNVPGVIGTGIRQFAGIFSVVDLSGNNIGTLSSNFIVFGNVIDAPEVDFFSPLVKFTGVGNNPVVVLSQPVAGGNQSNTQLRLGGSNGSFAISSATDAAPASPVANLIVGIRTGTSWNTLRFGDVSAPGTVYTFLGGGQITGGGITNGAPVDMTPDTGSFTANYAGFTGTVTGAATWKRVGPLVMLSVSPVSGVSNSSAFSLNNLPAAISPSLGYFAPMSNLCFVDNSINLATSGDSAGGQFGGNTISFSKSASTSGWTATGTKGISATALITYLL